MYKLHVFEGTTFSLILFNGSRSARSCVLFHLDKLATFLIFNYKTKRVTAADRLYFYDKKRDCVRFPVYLTNMLLHKVTTEIDVEVERKPLSIPASRVIDVATKEGIEDRPVQSKLITALVTVDRSMRALPLQTGLGKTYIAIRVITELKLATIIIVSGLIDQWKESLLKFTNLGDDDICLIQGAPSLQKLFKSQQQPLVFVISLETLRVYINNQSGGYDNIPTYEQFQLQFGIGLKIIDEAHEKFATVMLIEAFSRVPHNIYLSATFGRNDPIVQRTFDRIFPKNILVDVPDYKSYVHGYMYDYGSTIPAGKTITPKGYSHAKYEHLLLKFQNRCDSYMQHVLCNVLYNHDCLNSKLPRRTLIYCYTLAMVDAIYDYLQIYFPSIKVCKYVGNAPESQLKDMNYHIYLSTPKKCGRGSDIPDLRTVVCTISLSAKLTITQFLGRLRQIEGERLEYIDIYDRNNPSHNRHARIKQMVMKPKTVSFTQRTLGLV